MISALSKRQLAVSTAAALMLALVMAMLSSLDTSAYAVAKMSSSVRGSDGKLYTVTNHIIPGAFGHGRREYLLAWAGAADTSAGTEGKKLPAQARSHRDDDPEAPPDFIAVIDATKGSRTYGTVVNTATFTPQLQNEPHHLQYMWHKGQRIYAGGILSDTTFVLDPRHLPMLRLAGVNLPADTPCGSAPDAYQVLSDGTAYGTYMGGPNVSGPCTYTNGEVRVGNGFAGSPGEVVRIGPDGRTLAEIPAATPQGEDPEACHNIPALPHATCANPHGIQIREDLDRMLVSDFAEIRHFLDPTAVVTDEGLLRDTVRIYDISQRNDPRLVSVSHLPVGPRVDQLPAFDEDRMVMENAVTHQPRHKGAFASTMAGGAVYYTPDITAADPQWREVFDDTHAYRTFDSSGMLTGSNDGGSWLAVSPDDRFLFHGVMGSDPRLPRGVNSGMVYVLDIHKLLASRDDPRCRIDELEEVAGGGNEPDCPALINAVPIRDEVSPGVGVGPHWGASDNFQLGRDHFYHEAKHTRRIAVSDYFVAQTGIDGDHRVCMLDVAANGALSIDSHFRDEVTGQPCVNFNRRNWPHGAAGFARPHGILFVVPDRLIR